MFWRILWRLTGEDDKSRGRKEEDKLKKTNENLGAKN